MFAMIGLNWELVIVVFIAFLLFGNRLGGVMRDFGKGIHEFKKGINDVQEPINKAARDLKEPFEK